MSLVKRVCDCEAITLFHFHDFGHMGDLILIPLLCFIFKLLLFKRLKSHSNEGYATILLHFFLHRRIDCETMVLLHSNDFTLFSV